MGTRSDIIIHRADGTWARSYCHWDGYLEHNGRILFDHYTGQKKVDALSALGDLSKLGEEIGRKHPFDPPAYSTDSAKREAYEKKYGKMCRAYGRDRGQKDCGPIVGDSLFAVWPDPETWTEFTYVWDGEKWFCGIPDEGTQTLLDLGDLLQGKRTLAASVKVPFLGTIGRHGKTEPGKDHSWSQV